MHQIPTVIVGSLCPTTLIPKPSLPASWQPQTVIVGSWRPTNQIPIGRHLPADSDKQMVTVTCGCWLPAGRQCLHLVSSLVGLLAHGAIVHRTMDVSWTAHCFSRLGRQNLNEGIGGVRGSVGGSRRRRSVGCDETENTHVR